MYVAAGLNKPNPPYETADKFKGGVYIISPEGKRLDFIPIPVDEVTNCAFGGPDWKTLFITAGGRLWSTPVNAPGWTPLRRAEEAGRHSSVSFGPVVHREGLHTSSFSRSPLRPISWSRVLPATYSIAMNCTPSASAMS